MVTAVGVENVVAPLCSSHTRLQAFRGVGEMVVVQSGPDKLGRLLRKGMSLHIEQPHHLGLVLQQSVHQGDEPDRKGGETYSGDASSVDCTLPGIVLVRSQGCEPHLPVQSWLVGNDEGRSPVQTTRFVSVVGSNSRTQLHIKIVKII